LNDEHFVLASFGYYFCEFQESNMAAGETQVHCKVYRLTES